MQEKLAKTENYTKSFEKQALGKDNKAQNWHATLLPSKGLFRSYLL